MFPRFQINYVCILKLVIRSKIMFVNFIFFYFNILFFHFSVLYTVQKSQKYLLWHIRLSKVEETHETLEGCRHYSTTSSQTNLNIVQ